MPLSSLTPAALTRFNGLFRAGVSYRTALALSDRVTDADLAGFTGGGGGSAAPGHGRNVLTGMWHLSGYGADRTGVADSSPALTTLLADISAAGGEGTIWADPASVFSIGSLHTIPNGVQLWGGGNSLSGTGTVFRCSAAGAGLAIVGSGGSCRDFTVDGNGVSTLPLRRTSGSQRTFIAVDAYGSAQDNFHLYGAQNDTFLSCNFQNAARDNLTMDNGVGGHYFARCEFNNPGRDNLHVANDVTGGPYANGPSNCLFQKCIFERVGSTARSAIYLGVAFMFQFNECEAYGTNCTGPLIDVVGATLISWNAGYIVGSAGAVETGVRLAANTDFTLMGRPQLQNLAVGVTALATSAKCQLDTDVFWTNVASWFAVTGGTIDQVFRKAQTFAPSVLLNASGGVPAWQSYNFSGYWAHINADGSLHWGPGTDYATGDTHLARTGVGKLAVTGRILDGVAGVTRPWDFEYDFGAPTDGVTDCHTQMQNAINTMYAAGGGDLICGSRVYNLGSTSIDWPVAQAVPNPLVGEVTIRVLGAHPLAIVPWGPGDGTWSSPPIDHGTIFKSSCTTAGRSVFGGNLAAMTNLHFILENAVVRTYDNPQIGGIDGGWLLNMTLRNVVVDTGQWTGDVGGGDPHAISQPTHGTYGIVYPGNGNGAICVVDNVSAIGYGIGMRFCEHMSGHGPITPFKCGVGFQFTDGTHSGTFEQLCPAWCPIGVQSYLFNAANPTMACDIASLDFEESTVAGAWYNTVTHIDDSINKLRGHWKWLRVIPGQGSTGYLLRKGGAYLDLQPLAGQPVHRYDVVGFEGADGTATPTTVGGFTFQPLNGTTWARASRQFRNSLGNANSINLGGWETGKSELTIRTSVHLGTGTFNAGIAFNIMDVSNFLLASLSAVGLVVQKVDGNTFTTLPGGSYSHGYLTGEQHDLVVVQQGKQIVVFDNGVKVATATLTDTEWAKYSAGTIHGPFDYGDGSSTWDSFSFEAPNPYWQW